VTKGPLSIVAANRSRRGGRHNWDPAGPAAVALFLWWACCGSAAPSFARDLVPVTMTIGFPPSAYIPSNQNDAEAAFKVLGESIGRDRGFDLTVKTIFYRDMAAYHEGIEAGTVNFAILDAISYVLQPRQGDMSPIFVAAFKGLPGTRYLLVVRRGSGTRSLQALKGTRIVELQGPSLTLGHPWLKSLLAADHSGPPEDFFGSIEFVPKPTAAVLPVFFGSRDACIVDDYAFRLMEELNPQVGTRLEPIRTSVPLVSFVVCASKSHWSVPNFRPELIKMLGELQSDPGGRQILALFKLDQLIPFKEEYLRAVRDLCAASGRQNAGEP
jgi:ABC-type phosphate/phosphonate transport system substrate-binding protein